MLFLKFIDGVDESFLGFCCCCCWSGGGGKSGKGGGGFVGTVNFWAGCTIDGGYGTGICGGRWCVTEESLVGGNGAGIKGGLQVIFDSINK